MNPGIRQTWGMLSGTSKWMVAAAVGLVLMFAFSAGAGAWEHFRGWRFDNRDAAREKQIGDLNKSIAEKDQAVAAEIRRAVAAEAKAQLKEQEAETLAALNKQLGRQSEAAAKKVSEAFDALEKDAAVTGADVSDEERKQRICQKRRELKLRCK